MALSGTVSFNLTRAEAIESAYNLIGVVSVGDPVPAELVDLAVRTMNMMLKTWDADGLHLWKEDEGILFPVVGQQSYLLGPGGMQACLKDDYVRTTANGNQTVTTTLTVHDSTGMANADKVGYELDEVIVWTTITSIAGNILTIPNQGGASVLDGAVVYSYTTLIERPTRLLDARRIVEGDSEVPIILFSRQEYMAMTMKSSRGAITQAYYDPKLTNGRLYVWPTFGDVDQVLGFTFERQLQDMSGVTNTFDIPQEWLEPMVWNLADRLGMFLQIPAENKVALHEEAMEKYQYLLAFDQENTSIMVMPDTTWERR